MSIKIMSMVWEASNAMLTPTEKSILLRLADFAANDGTSIYPSWKRIENDTGFSRRCIAENLVKLQEKKVLIKVHEADKKKHLACVYRIDVPLLHSWEALGIDEEDEDMAPDASPPPSAPAATPSAFGAPTPSAPGAPHPSLNNQIKYDFKKNPEKEGNTTVGKLDENQELTQEGRNIAEKAGLLPEMITIQFQKFKDYNLQKGFVLVNWHSSWSSWCQRAIQYKPELKFTPVEKPAGSKIYGKFPVQKGFNQNFTAVEDKEGRLICTVYWDSSVGHWAQSDGTVWEFTNEQWYKK